MESIQRNEDQNEDQNEEENEDQNEDQNEYTQHKENNKLITFEHNDVVFFKHKDKNKIGIGRVVNFYTELKINDILLPSDHNVTLANCIKILNNINDEKYVQSYIANSTSEYVDSTPYQASTSNANEKINCKPYEKDEKQDYKHADLKEKNEDNEIQATTRTGSNNNNANNPEFKCEMKKRRRRKKKHALDDTALIHTNSISNGITRKNDEKRRVSKLFYIVQSLENYKYSLQYKKSFKHYKIFTHNKWELIKSLFCKNIQNKISFVLAVKLLEVKKVYANNINLQNVMINNLMKIYKSERDLHVDHLVLNYIKKVDVRIILQNNVLITNDDFNEIFSRHRKKIEEDRKRTLLHSNNDDAHLDEANSITQGEMTHLWDSYSGSSGSVTVGSDYDDDIKTPHQGGHVHDQQNDMHNSSNVNYVDRFPVDWGHKEPPNFGKKHPPKYAMKYLIHYGKKQPTDSLLYSHDREGTRTIHKKDNINLQNYKKKRKVIEGETYQYELKGNLLAKFKSPQGRAYRGCIKSICKGKNNIFSYFLIVPSCFWFNDSYYFSCLNIDIDIFQLLEIIKIVDNSKKKQIESISFARYKSLGKINDCVYNPKPNEVQTLLQKGPDTDNTPLKVRVRAPKRDITKKRRKRRKSRTLQVELGKRKRKIRGVDKRLKASVTKEKTRGRVKKRKKRREECLDDKAGRGFKIKKQKKQVVQPEVTEKKSRGRKKKVVPIQENSNGEDAKKAKGMRKVEEVQIKKEMEEESCQKKVEVILHENETKAQNNETEANPLFEGTPDLDGDDTTNLMQNSSTKSNIFNLNSERTKSYFTKLALFFKISQNSNQQTKQDDEEGKKGTETQTIEADTARENNYVNDDNKVTTSITNTNENEQNVNVMAKVNEEKEDVNFRKEDRDDKAPNENTNQGCANMNEIRRNEDDEMRNTNNTLISKLIANGKEVDYHNLLDPPSVGKGSANDIHIHDMCQQKNVDEHEATILDHIEHLNDNDGNIPTAVIEEGVVQDNPTQIQENVEPFYQKMDKTGITNEEEIFKKENFGVLNEDDSDAKRTHYKNGILGDKTDSLNGDSRSYQNESTISQNSYERKGTTNDYNARDQNDSWTSQNSYEKKESVNCDNLCDRNEFTASPKYDEKIQQTIEPVTCEVKQQMYGALMSFSNEQMNGTIISDEKHVDNPSNTHLRKVSNTNNLVKKEPEENNNYNLTVHMDLSNKNHTSKMYSTTQDYYKNFCKNKCADHINKFRDDEKIKKIETLYKFCKEDINILLYVYVMHIYVNKLCKNVIVKVLNPKCKNVKKTKYSESDFILTPLIGYSYANYYYLKINKRKGRTKMKTKTGKKKGKKNKIKIKTEIKTEKKIDRRFKQIKNNLITKKGKRKKKKKLGRKKKLIEQVKTEVKRGRKRKRRRKRTHKMKSNLLCDTFVKPKMSKSSLNNISKMKNMDDKTYGKTKNVIKCTTQFVNFYLWGIYNWNYNKTLRISFNNISNKKITNFDIYNFFFYNYDTISNLNEINKDLSTLISIYKNIRTVLYQNSSIYGNLLLLKPTNTMARTHSDDELIKFWLKTLNELHQVREGFCKFF
ncbi:hypothetical protein AK88_01838 [Plasmodium fragile]|uniref:Uncharacterized protein n=1 Tax=Plasmodium fragile TaxID=5857 RepID=A0A0D9QNB9_PLAFR|nr:uncharacterized protein AK88_01838 [Plasmodium fragile]KJP88559.1 hypothetical protein AK88_01838 [Plasmodium fragile]